MTSDKAVEMFVAGIVVDPGTQAPVVVLKTEDGAVWLPIWIGMAEATSIASCLKQLPLNRPLTHDLLHDVILQGGMNLQRVMISDLKDATYFAELVISKGDRAIMLDCRPSDAINLAIRFSAPIYVAPHVVEQAKIAFTEAPSGREILPEEEGAKEGLAGGEGEGAPSESAAELLADLAAEDAVADLTGPLASGDQGDFRTLDKEKWEELLKKLNPDDFKYEM